MARVLVVFVCLACLLSAWPAAGQASAHRRLIEKFDFENTVDGVKLGRHVPMPPHFFAIGRAPDTADPNFLRQPIQQQLTSLEGYPRYGEVGFSDHKPFAGEFALHLGLNGGNSGAFIEVGTLPAVPFSDYLVTAMVRTEGIRHASARVTAYFVDVEGHRIDESVVTTREIRTGGRWQTVSLALRGDFRKAAWIVIQTELLQPRHDPEALVGKHQVVLQDVAGHAWFDDVAVWQVPRIIVRTQSDVGIVRAPLRPKLSFEVRDLSGHALVAEVTVYDEAHRRIDGHRQSVGDGGPSAWGWEPKLLRFGWYLVELELYDQRNGERARVARQPAGFLYLPAPEPVAAEALQSVGFTAQGIPLDQYSLLADLLDSLHLGQITLDAWRPTTTRDSLDTEQVDLDRTLQRIMGHGRRVTLALNPLPPELMRQLGAREHDALYMLQQPRDTWMPFLAPVMLRHGQGIRQWQIGMLDAPEAFFADDYRGSVSHAIEVLRDLTPEPRIFLPWSLAQSPRSVGDPAMEPSFAIDVPSSIEPRHLADHLRDWLGDGKPTDFSLRLNVRDATVMNQPRRVDDMAHRVVHAWEAGVRRLDVGPLWTHSNDRRHVLMPDPVLGVFAQTVNLLQGYRVVGRLPMGRGLVGLICRRGNEGMLIAWNESAPPEDAAIRMKLGEQPVAIDVWGNRTAIKADGARHHVPLTSTPLFIRGIDPELAVFRASLRLESNFIEARQTPHEREIVLHNPWPRTISGSITILGLEGWRISPRKTTFNIAAGETTRIPVQLVFPISEVAGDKTLTARLEFLADQAYDILAETPFKLGLENVDFDANLTIEPNAQTGSRDVVVTQLITNRGSEPLSIYAFANMRGFPRQERIVAQLRPGQSVVRRFRFPDAAAMLADRPVRVGLRETQGPAILNKLLSADDL